MTTKDFASSAVVAVWRLQAMRARASTHTTPQTARTVAPGDWRVGAGGVPGVERVRGSLCGRRRPGRGPLSDAEAVIDPLPS